MNAAAALLALDTCPVCGGRGQVATGTGCTCCGGRGMVAPELAAQYLDTLRAAQLEGARERARQLGAAGADMLVREAAAARTEAAAYYRATEAAARRAEGKLWQARNLHTQSAAMLAAARDQVEKVKLAAVGPVLPPIPPGQGPNLPGGVMDPIIIADSIRVRQIDVWGNPGINAPNYPASQGLLPSGDTSGVKDTAAIAAAFASSSSVTINTAAGPWYVGAAGSGAAGITLPQPGGRLVGNNGGFTNAAGTVITPHPVYYLGTGTAVSALGPVSQGTPHAYPSNVMGFNIADIVFDGSLGGGAADGITYGNGDSMRMDHVRVANFGGRGLHEVTNAGGGSYSEKLDINAQAFFCGIGLQFDAPSGTNSHFYSRWNLHVEGCTIGVQFVNAAGIHGGQFRMFGNFYPAVGPNGIGVDFSAGVNNTGHFDASVVTIQVETTGAGASTFQTCRFGTNLNAGFHNCTGFLLFADPAWTNSDVHAGQISFGGYINNQDTTLLTNNSPAPSGWLTLSGTLPLSNSPGGFTSNPATPANTVVMTGANQTYTPTGSGILVVIMTCVAWTNTAAVSFTVGARHSTGAVPNPGDPVTGARINATGEPNRQAAAAGVGDGTVTIAGVLTVTPNVQQWFDFCVSTSVAADTVQIAALQINVIEL